MYSLVFMVYIKTSFTEDYLMYSLVFMGNVSKKEQYALLHENFTLQYLPSPLVYYPT